MITFFLFAATIQCLIVCLSIIGRATTKYPESVMFLLLMGCFQLFLTKCFLVEAGSGLHLSVNPLYFPYHFASGPILYLFIRFHLLPYYKTSKWWLLSLVPAIIEILMVGCIWGLMLLQSPWKTSVEYVLDTFVSMSLWYVLLFVMMSIAFIIKQKTTIILTIIYKKNILNIAVILSLVFLFICVDVFFSNDNTPSYAIMCLLMGTIVFILLKNSSYFINTNSRGLNLLNAALSESVKAVVITDADRIICYANEPFATMTGYSIKEAMGRKPSFLQGPLTTTEQITTIRSLLKTGTPFVTDLINYRKNREAYVCRVAISPIYSDGKITHFIAFEEDIETISASPIDQDEHQLVNDLIQILDQEQIYKNPHLQLADIALKLQVSPRKLSETLKKVKDQSFSQLINQYRVAAANDMLQDKVFNKYTIEAIGSMAGFNSKTAFYTVYKKIKGQSPSRTSNVQELEA
jgi:PAS domain S-box-containing protein